MAKNMVKNSVKAVAHYFRERVEDSMVALYWICNHRKEWIVFVSNQGTKIAEITQETGIV